MAIGHAGRSHVCEALLYLTANVQYRQSESPAIQIIYTKAYSCGWPHIKTLSCIWFVSQAILTDGKTPNKISVKNALLFATSHISQGLCFRFKMIHGILKFILKSIRFVVRRLCVTMLYDLTQTKLCLPSFTCRTFHGLVPPKSPAHDVVHVSMFWEHLEGDDEF